MDTTKGKLIKAIAGVVVIAVGIYVGMAAVSYFPMKKKDAAV